MMPELPQRVVDCGTKRQPLPPALLPAVLTEIDPELVRARIHWDGEQEEGMTR